MQIYNTLTRKKQEFEPITPGEIKMYVCGPTVYDDPHIGHARSAYVFDVIRRYLEFRGNKVFFVRNVTDVDDKIINRAVTDLKNKKKEYSQEDLKNASREIAEKYLRVYHDELGSLGILPPTEEPKATENISDIIDFVSKLIEKGYAYISGGSVYFSVDKFKGYGKLSNQDKEQMMHGTRKDVEEEKRHPLDFALWKKAKEKEPYWPSPWGGGRPGWHIECSVMSTKILGEEFDIHGGGLDLIFPHHENEIAQSEALTGKSFARFWVHNGLLMVNGEKMSKSLGNFMTINDFLKKYKDADTLKIIFLNSHYRSPVDCTDEKIEESKKTKSRIMIFCDKVSRLGEEAGRVLAKISGSVDKKSEEQAEKDSERILTGFTDTMDDDFNTPEAMSVIFEAVRTGNEYLADEKIGTHIKFRLADNIKNCVLKMTNVLGLALKEPELDKDTAAEIEVLVLEREKARKNRDFALADKIRKSLMDKGVIVEDTPKGPVWRKN